MKRIYAKVFITAVALLLSATMVVSVCYAWLVISKSPAVNGITVMIGGGKTILLAPDLTEEVTDSEGNTQLVHYPGAFEDTLNFSAYESYTALSESGTLAPVSTADGVDWLIPQYGENGELLGTDAFVKDSTLEYANKKDGRYICLDLWIVSPGSAYDVRVSMDKQTGEGSYLIELPAVEERENGSFTLAQSQNIVSASARVGFLVSGEKSGDAALTAYLNSADCDKRYATLRGVYAEPGETRAAGDARFTIYEPNGTLHPNGESGSYSVTSPLRVDESGAVLETDISDRLSVQTQSTWKPVPTLSGAEAAEAGESAGAGAAGTGEETNAGESTGSGEEETIYLEQILQTALAGMERPSLSTAQDRYMSYLRGQEGAYLDAGVFLRDTAALYAAATDGEVSAEAVQAAATAGASDGAVITRLERNTPQRVRMYLWLEGQDPDCRNTGSVDLTQVALKIELAGSTP